MKPLSLPLFVFFLLFVCCAALMGGQPSPAPAQVIVPQATYTPAPQYVFEQPQTATASVLVPGATYQSQPQRSVFRQQVPVDVVTESRTTAHVPDLQIQSQVAPAAQVTYAPATAMAPMTGCQCVHCNCGQAAPASQVLGAEPEQEQEPRKSFSNACANGSRIGHASAAGSFAIVNSSRVNTWKR